MFKQAELTFEYLQSLRVINKLTPAMINEVDDIIENVIKVTQNTTIMDNIKNTLSDINNILEQVMILFKDDNIDKQLVIEMVTSLVGLILDMKRDIVKVVELLEQFPLANDHKLHIKYQLDYLRNLLKEIVY